MGTRLPDDCAIMRQGLHAAEMKSFVPIVEESQPIPGVQEAMKIFAPIIEELKSIPGVQEIRIQPSEVSGKVESEEYLLSIVVSLSVRQRGESILFGYNTKTGLCNYVVPYQDFENMKTQAVAPNMMAEFLMRYIAYRGKVHQVLAWL